MPETTAKTAFWAGARNGAPFILMAAPFALVYGVLAVEAGLTLAQTMGFSVLVIAGASQFAALQMMVDNAAVALVLLAALAVNLRMAMYSAAMVPHIGPAPLWHRALVAYLLFDQTYIASVARYEDRPQMTVAQKVAYYFGVATPITPLWIICSLIGASVGATIPDSWAMDFALPLFFTALVAPMLKSLPHVVAAGVSVAVALVLSGLPSGFGLIVAALCAMLAGAMVEQWMEARR
ncbi:MAG: AzlC family ABC transporter permease [Loktanella sp.]|nr:AzlC family ABC transporter permease [Loktanella sp.]